MDRTKSELGAAKNRTDEELQPKPVQPQALAVNSLAGRYRSVLISRGTA